MSSRPGPSHDRPVDTLFCPRCISSHLYLSRPWIWERVVTVLTGVRPYRCRRCGWRGWRWRR